MTLPLQQAGDPTSARKVRLPLYVAMPEPELLTQDFYAAGVEKLGAKPFASRPQVITRSHLYMLNLRGLAWFGRPAVELNFHPANTVWSALQQHMAQFVVFCRPHPIPGALQLA